MGWRILWGTRVFFNAKTGLMILVIDPSGGRKFYESLYSLATVYTPTILLTGEVKFLGKVDSISYNLKEWKDGEILIDFAKTRMVELLKRKGFKIYECKEL